MHPSPLLGLLLVLLVLPVVAACSPELPSSWSSGQRCRSATTLEATLEPDASLAAAPVAVRIHVRRAEDAQACDEQAALEPDSLLLLRGTLGSAQLAQLARGEPSQALLERRVPSLAWAEQGGDVVVAPLEPLAAGQTYSVATGAPATAVELQTSAGPSSELLRRVWPPAESGAGPIWGVWCGERTLSPLSASERLAPLGPTGELAAGALGDGFGMACLRFEETSHGAGSPGPWVAPPAWSSLPDETILVEPTALGPGEPAAPARAPACAEDEVAFGPGCAWVADDRLLVTPPDEPLLWAVVGEGLDQVVASEPSVPFWVQPLPAASTIALELRWLDTRGGVQAAGWGGATQPAMPHLVLNEVLADPVGPEPAQEWIELYNDGQASAALADFRLLDPAGETALPAARLDPGGYALLVNEAFEPETEFDLPPAPGTLLVPVAELGHGGLANDGEPLVLRDAGGRAVSRFPGTPKPKRGVSVARTSPGAPDGSTASFVRSPQGSTPGEPNGLEQ